MGIMAGIIFVLAFLLLAQHNEQVAYASSSPQDTGGAGGTFMATGGTGQNQTDMIWILYRRGVVRKTGKDAAAMAKLTGPNRLTLCAYRMGQGTRPKMQFLSARDISFDVEMLDFNSSPTVNSVVRELRKQKKK